MTASARNPRTKHRRRHAWWLPAAAIFAMAAVALPARLCAQAPRSLLDLASWNTVHEQETAQHALEQAREAVDAARQAAAEAKAQLEQTAVQPFQGAPAEDEPSLDETASPADDAPGAALEDDMLPREPSGNAAANPQGASRPSVTIQDIEHVEQKIRSLKSQRDDLLTHYTTAHPLVIDIDVRLEEYGRRLADLKDFLAITTARPPADVTDRQAPARSQAAAEAARQMARQKEAAERMQQALKRWQNAERALQSAIDAELAAAEKLAALGALAAAEAAEQEAKQPVPAEPARLKATHDESTRSSQPLVLAALIVALVIAALASVKLARASDETVFGGADDAATALALPVVGVIPAMTLGTQRASLSQRFRGVVIACQVLVAIAIFALVAYLVQNPAEIWQLVNDPLDALRGGAP